MPEDQVMGYVPPDTREVVLKNFNVVSQALLDQSYVSDDATAHNTPGAYAVYGPNGAVKEGTPQQVAAPKAKGVSPLLLLAVVVAVWVLAK